VLSGGNARLDDRYSDRKYVTERILARRDLRQGTDSSCVQLL